MPGPGGSPLGGSLSSSSAPKFERGGTGCCPLTGPGLAKRAGAASGVPTRVEPFLRLSMPTPGQGIAGAALAAIGGPVELPEATGKPTVVVVDMD
mmetsp:Transcript_73931/g.171504  ORF Transcript_73931/g.171504 Transcript_73931/m.171504 type:complete len:95 (-) Transcript_73931:1295-1579(-)